MSIQKTNCSPAFGMAFRVNGYKGAKALAEKFHSFSDPAVAEKYFVKDVVKPLEKVKSDVLFDGTDVFVIDGYTKDKYKLLNEMPVKTDKAVKYPVQHEGKKTTFDIFHNGTVDEVQTDKFKIGVKIAELNLSESLCQKAPKKLPEDYILCIKRYNVLVINSKKISLMRGLFLYFRIIFPED